jgi:protein O-mannosyl-transferase
VNPRTQQGAATERDTRLLAFLLGLVFLVFSVTLGNEFVEFDDFLHIRDNARFQSGSLWAFWEFWQAPFFGLYVPVTYTVWSFAAMLSHAFMSTLSPGLFHALNVGVHVLNVYLVYRLLRILLGERANERRALAAAAVFGAALFGLHPTQVESVAWASELRGLISATLGFSALLLWLSARARADGARSRAAMQATVLFALALLAKPTAVAFPPMLLAIERWAPSGTTKDTWRLPGIWLALGALVVLLTRTLQPDIDLDYVPSMPERLLVALDALGFYAYKLLLPFQLGMDYGRSPHAVLTGHLYLVSGAFALALIALVLGFGRTRPWLLCAGALTLAALLPVLGLVPFEFQFYSTVADRYLYVAQLGVALAAAHGFLQLSARVESSARKQQAALGACALAGVLALASHVQARSWHSTASLFTQALAVNADSFAAQHGLARVAYEARRYEQVAQHCRAALAAKPDYLPAQQGLGDAQLALGDRDGAIRTYREAIAQHEGATGKRGGLLADVHTNLAVALSKAGDADAAIAHLQKALTIRPDLQLARRNLGRLLLRRGDSSAAIEQFRVALAANPRDQASRQELERALTVQQRAAP